MGSVAEYLSAQPPDRRRVLKRVRAAIKKALGGADEVISYGIPAFRVAGRVVIFFAGWKEHVAIYPVGALVEKQLREELARYSMSKGTIRFPLDEKVPTALITKIAKLRAMECAALAPAKRAAKNERPAGGNRAGGGTRATSAKRASGTKSAARARPG